MNFIYVFLGGGLGSLCRYLIGLIFQNSGLSLPVATLVANVTACVLFAVTINFMQGKTEDATLKLLVLTGICGGLSTFSTFGYETYLLLKQQNYLWMALNIFLSVALCLMCFFLIKK